MGRKIRLTESDFHRLIKRLVKETQEEMMMDTEVDIEDEDMGGEDLEKPEVVKLISQFFKTEVLPELDPEEKSELRQELGQENLDQLSEMYLNENLSDRMASFKEKAMMRGGLGVAAMGAIASVSQFMGWSESDTLAKIHDFVQDYGAGSYSGPISMAMVAAGLALALRGRAKRYQRTGR